jgi:hypothetical protein
MSVCAQGHPHIAVQRVDDDSFAAFAEARVGCCSLIKETARLPVGPYGARGAFRDISYGHGADALCFVRTIIELFE